MSSLASQAQANERVVGHGAVTFEHVRRRRDALEASGIDGLIVPTRVALQSQDAVVVTEPAHEGVTLQDVLHARGSLHAGECVWWAAQVAQLLASLHKVGVAHGALTAEAIIIDGDGVRLGRLVDGGSGTAGPDDVAALGELLATCVRADEAARVQAWAEPMQHERADARPSAAMVARAITSCAPAQPIDIPVRDVVGSMRRSASARHEVERMPGAWWWRLRVLMRRRWWVGAIATGLAVVVGVAIAAGTAGAGDKGTQSPVTAVGPLETPRMEESPEEAAVRLTLDRFAAMATGDGEELVSLTLPGSPAHADALATAALFAEGRLELTTTSGVPAPPDLAVRTESRSDVRDTSAGKATVIVTYSSPAYEVTLDGVSSAVEAEKVSIRMVLGWDAREGWRVADAIQSDPDASDSAT